MRVYIAGKLNAMACEYIRNMHQMISYGEQLRRRGFSVFIPCLDILLGMMFGDWDYEDYFHNSQPWLEVSDILFVCPGWEASSGTKREMIRARELGIPICCTMTEVEAVRERMERGSNESLLGLYEEPGEPGDVPRLELAVSDVSDAGPEHVAE
jgi:hypothetical protein